MEEISGPKDLPTENMSPKKATKVLGEKVTKHAMLEELTSLVDLQVFSGRYQNLLTDRERKKILRMIVWKPPGTVLAQPRVGVWEKMSWSLILVTKEFDNFFSIFV